MNPQSFAKSKEVSVSLDSPSQSVSLLMKCASYRRLPRADSDRLTVKNAGSDSLGRSALRPEIDKSMRKSAWQVHNPSCKPQGPSLNSICSPSRCFLIHVPTSDFRCLTSDV